MWKNKLISNDTNIAADKAIDLACGDMRVRVLDAEDGGGKAYSSIWEQVYQKAAQTKLMSTNGCRQQRSPGRNC